MHAKSQSRGIQSHLALYCLWVSSKVAPGSSFDANDMEYKYGDYFVDGIYLECTMLEKPFLC